MNKDFSLDYAQRNGIVFNISNIKDRDVETDNIDIDLVKENMLVTFYSGFIEKARYGNQTYFK